jgi:hypothetical protein
LHLFNNDFWIIIFDKTPVLDYIDEVFECNIDYDIINKCNDNKYITTQNITLIQNYRLFYLLAIAE